VHFAAFRGNFQFQRCVARFIELHFTAIMAKFPDMNWTEKNLGEEFKLFKQKMELCFLDNNITNAKKKAVKIKIAVGSEGLRKINASGLSEDDEQDPDKLWELFETQLQLRVNFRVHRLELMRYKQKEDEKIDDFVNRCRDKARECNFSEDELNERIIELVIASTRNEAFQKDLLDKPVGHKLEDLLKDGRKYEAITATKQCLQQLDMPTGAINTLSNKEKKCGNCGLVHRLPQRCPAYHDLCKVCNKKGHWAKMCRSSRNRGRQRDRDRPPDQKRHSSKRRWTNDRSQSRRPNNRRSDNRRKVHEIDTTQREQHDGQPIDKSNNDTVTFYSMSVSDLCFDSVKASREEAYTTIDVVCPERQGQHRLNLKVDTGASGNTLPLRTIKQMYQANWKKVIQPTNAKLTAYNGSTISCLGQVDIVCRYRGSEWSTHRFYVVDVPGPAVIGLPTCDKLNVVTIHAVNELPPLPHNESPPTSTPQINSVQDLIKMYPQQFDTIGSFKGEAKLHLKDDARPSIDAPRKCSVHLRDKLQKELQTMEKQGVIRKINHHTDWCSSLTTTVKKDGSLRVCLDPKRLNQSLKRCPHKIPTLEELNPSFAKAKYFSKLDAKAGYWSVHLAKESQELTTFRTPFGRYCFRRLPFGLSVSQDIFQQFMDNILEEVPGCAGGEATWFGF